MYFTFSLVNAKYNAESENSSSLNLQHFGQGHFHLLCNANPFKQLFRSLLLNSEN